MNQYGIAVLFMHKGNIWARTRVADCFAVLPGFEYSDQKREIAAK